MSIDYPGLQSSATSLLTDFGQTITRTTVTVGDYDPAAGEAVVTTSSSSRIGVLLNYGKDAQQYVRGNLVEMSDRKLLVDATGPVALTDRYTVGGTEYTVVSIKPTNPGGIDVLFELHVRQS